MLEIWNWCVYVPGRWKTTCGAVADTLARTSIEDRKIGVLRSDLGSGCADKLCTDCLVLNSMLRGKGVSGGVGIDPPTVSAFFEES